jgi:hypothetical protein
MKDLPANSSSQMIQHPKPPDHPDSYAARASQQKKRCGETMVSVYHHQPLKCEVEPANGMDMPKYQ